MSLVNCDSVQQIDHYLPIVSFNLLDENNMKKCFNWINLRPLYSNKSNSKKAKTDHYLYLCREVRAKYFLELNDQEGLNENFFDEIDSNPPRKNFPTKKNRI